MHENCSTTQIILRGIPLDGQETEGTEAVPNTTFLQQRRKTLEDPIAEGGGVLKCCRTCLVTALGTKPPRIPKNVCNNTSLSPVRKIISYCMK
jgi:hypothetical protein